MAQSHLKRDIRFESVFILDAKHEQIAVNNQYLFFCLYSKTSSYSRQKLSDVTRKKIWVFLDDFFMLAFKIIDVRNKANDYWEICKTFHCGTAWRGNFPAEIVFSTSTMWRMELSVVWMVATGKLQYPLQKPVSSLSQTVIGGRKRFHLCFGFQFWTFLFYKYICRIKQIWNSAVVSPKLKWIGEWKNHRYGRTPDVIWILDWKK